MKKYTLNTALFLCDSFFLWIVYCGVGWLREISTIFGMPSFMLYAQKDFFLVYALIALILVYEKIYYYRFDFWEETKLTLKALLLSFTIVLSFLMLNKINTEYSRSFLVMYFVSLLLFMPIFKRYIKKILFSFIHLRKKVKIIGDKEQKKVIADEFKKNWYLGLRSVESGQEAIFIVTKNMSIEILNGYLNKYMKESKDLYLLPYVSKVNFAEANMMEYFNIRASVIHIENELLKPRNIVLKEIFEKLITLMMIPAFLLLHVIISYLIHRDSKGSILFKQNRLGKNNCLFECLKYRTMFEKSEEILSLYLQNHPDDAIYYEKYHKYKNDPRITKLGKFLRKTSLDELPQIINILKGNMNLVGPRPYMVEEMEKVGDDLHTILSVKPGITGLWQVSGRSNITFEGRKELDIWYIQNWSLWMDLVILIKTIKVVLFKKGAQ